MCAMVSKKCKHQQSVTTKEMFTSRVNLCIYNNFCIIVMMHYSVQYHGAKVCNTHANPQEDTM